MDKIIDLIHLNITVEFSMGLGGRFSIKLSNTDKGTGRINANRVDLPFDHLNETKINRYLGVLSESLLESMKNNYNKSKLNNKINKQ